MAISTQEYVVRLRAIYQQVKALSKPDGSLPTVSDLGWMEIFARVFQAVPELEQHWDGIGNWVDSMTILLGYYHRLAAQLLEEEDTAEIAATPLPEGRRRLLDYQAYDTENKR
jgi:hypothetical protein